MYSDIKASSPGPSAREYTCTALKFSLDLIDQEELARLQMSTIPGDVNSQMTSPVFNLEQDSRCCKR